MLLIKHLDEYSDNEQWLILYQINSEAKLVQFSNFNSFVPYAKLLVSSRASFPCG